MLKADAFNIVRRKKLGVARCAVLGYLHSVSTFHIRNSQIVNSKRERERQICTIILSRRDDDALTSAISAPHAYLSHCFVDVECGPKTITTKLLITV